MIGLSFSLRGEAFLWGSGVSETRFFESKLNINEIFSTLSQQIIYQI